MSSDATRQHAPNKTDFVRITLDTLARRYYAPARQFLPQAHPWCTRGAGSRAAGLSACSGQTAQSAQTNPAQASAGNLTAQAHSAPQQSSKKPSGDQQQSDLAEIVVTGTHIRGGSVASPVIDIGREEIDRSGYTSIAALMQSLPQNFGGGYSAASMVANSVVNVGYADNPAAASVPNLRGWI